MKINKTFINKLINDPYEILKTLTIVEIVELIQTANHKYYNLDTPLFDDQIFDIIKEYLAEIAPGHPVLNNVGASVSTSNKVKLPFYMGSLDKIKNDEKAFTNWKNKYVGEYVISDKLDGNSGLIVFQGNGFSMYSRGDGTYGQPISHLLPFLKNSFSFNSDKFLKHGEHIAIRGELIISKEDFSKIADKNANARNTVAGLINAKLPDLQVAKITSFVGYEVLFPIMTPNKQMEFIDKILKIQCVYNEFLSNEQLTLDNLSNTLVKRRQTSPFEIDGIVVTHNHIYKNNNKTNPEHSFAFKSVITMEKAEVIVTKVEWNMSKDGIFVPIVHFTPVNLDGVVITKSHGFNGKFIKDNSIAPGAIIIIMRSGAVIPYIVETIKKAPSPQMPDTPFVWNKTGVDILVDANSMTNEDNNQLQLKNLEYFFDKVDVPGLSGGILKRIYDKGFNTIGKITGITKEQLLTVDGFKDKMAEKISSALHNRFIDKGSNIDLFLLMDASNILGRGIGSKKIKLICDDIPDIIGKRIIPNITQLTNIKGVEEKTAKLFIDNLPKIFKFFDDNNLTFERNTVENNNQELSPTANIRISGKSFVFSGVRDKDLEKLIVDNGGVVSTSVSSKTSILLVKTIDDESSKMTKAKTLGITIMTIDDFKNEINT
jgi:NAD-dependent DNA ligase